MTTNHTFCHCYVRRLVTQQIPVYHENFLDKIWPKEVTKFCTVWWYIVSLLVARDSHHEFEPNKNTLLYCTFHLTEIRQLTCSKLIHSDNQGLNLFYYTPFFTVLYRKTYLKTWEWTERHYKIHHCIQYIRNTVL